MLPSKSNNKENCSPTSSNCVVWQGPNISCINLCTGDSVSDVVYKLAEEICALKDNAGISDVDLTCLVTACQNTATPSKTLANILQLLIDKVCCISEKVDDLPPPVDPYLEPELDFPICNAFSGFPSDVLHHEYTLLLAQKICSMYDDIATNTVNIAAHEVRIDGIEAIIPTLMVKMNLDSCLSNTTIPLQTLLVNLENAFCLTNDALGDAAALTAVLDKQCVTNSTKRLDNPSLTLSTTTGWVSTPVTLADNITNLWITVCDIRNAVKLIQDNCCKVDCSKIEIDFYQAWSTEEGEESTLRLNFKAKSLFLNGFYDCGQTLASPNTSTNSLTFTDINGLSIPVPILFRSINYPTGDITGAFDSDVYGWYNIDLSGTGLDVTGGPLTVTTELCFTDGTIQCTKCYTWTIEPYVGSCCEVTATDNVTLTYSICEAPTTPPDFNQLVEQINSNPLSFSPVPPCELTYVTVNLTAGQTFVIPQGATVTYVSDRTKVTSTCIDFTDVPTDPDPSGPCGTGILSAITSNASSANCVAGDGDLNIIDYVNNEPHCGINGVVCVELEPSLGSSCTGSFVVKVIVNGIITYTSGTYTVGNTTVCVPVSATSNQNVTILFDFPF